MPCYHPIPAWRTANRVQLHKDMPDGQPLQVPCGTCLGCRASRAEHWALRCHLESHDHEHTSVTTLTYDNDHLPLTLHKRHLQLWLKRLRKQHRRPIRYLGCGEYGERYGRPHYHVILFGVRHQPRTPKDSLHPLIQNAWPHGLTYTDTVSPEAINYVTHYTVKKAGWNLQQEERMDPDTGELYTWQPPFQLMSRRPGIGAQAKQHYKSWALYAVNNGHTLSVPRYLKGAFNDNATIIEKEDNEYQKYQHALTRHTTTEEQLKTKEKIHYARRIAQSALRRYE